MGTFCGVMISNITGIDDGPLWANAIGIIVGCLLGIAIPKMIIGDSEHSGLNKIKTRTILIGNMDVEQLEAIIDSKPLVD